MNSTATPASAWNVPNKISAARLGLSLIVFLCLSASAYVAALAVFFLAAATDWVDGWYARRYQQVTQLGRVLDPFCDKILIGGVFIFLVEATTAYPWYLRVSAWIAVVIVGREILVTAIRSVIESSGGDFSARWAGKIKMGLQCLAAAAAMLALAWSPDDAAALPPWLAWTLAASLWAALASTVHSGVAYVRAAAPSILQARS